MSSRELVFFPVKGIPLVVAKSTDPMLFPNIWSDFKRPAQVNNVNLASRHKCDVVEHHNILFTTLHCGAETERNRYNQALGVGVI